MWCYCFVFLSLLLCYFLGVQLDPRTIEYLHHIVVFKCRNSFTEMFGNCGDPTSDIVTSGAAPDCHTFGIIGVWAVGGSSVDFPLDAGILLGPDETFHSFLLEIHYDNPQMDVGKEDDSGLIFYYTETLRQHNVGLFHMGHFENEHMQIPPGAESFLVQEYCPPACFDFVGDIKVIVSGVHSHSAGIALWTQIIRNKKEIGYLNINRNYDFEYQVSYHHTVLNRNASQLIPHTNSYYVKSYQVNRKYWLRCVLIQISHYIQNAIEIVHFILVVLRVGGWYELTVLIECLNISQI